jgi:hypothetical protein
VNALRRRYQRTLNNEDLRSERKLQYNEGKRQYHSKLKNVNFKSWQNYCTLTEEPNPWNAIYKTASGKSRSKTCLTGRQQPDRTFTFDTESKTKHTLDYFVPEDNETDDSAVHRQIREQVKEPVDTEEDKPFSRREIASSIQSLILKRLLGRMD